MEVGAITHWVITITRWVATITHWVIMITRWVATPTHQGTGLTHWVAGVTRWGTTIPCRRITHTRAGMRSAEGRGRTAGILKSKQKVESRN